MVMRALQLDEPGGYRQLHIGSAAKPEPAEDEVLVRVAAVGLNPVDYKSMVNGHPAWTYPHIPGLDVAGVVEKVGSRVTDFRGQERVVFHGNLSRQGGLADYAVATARTVSRIADNIDFATAASMPCAGMTAWHALTRRLHLRSGQSLLVQAGGGGVGSFAVQLGKHLGAVVYATCSTRSVAYVRSLGVDSVVDYTRDNLREQITKLTGGRGVDAIIETQGEEQAGTDLKLLAFGGGMACLLGFPSLETLAPFTISPSLHEVSLGGAHLFGDHSAQQDLARMGDELIGLLASGRIRAPKIEVFRIERAVEAFDLLSSGHVQGKLVIQQ